MDKGEGPGGGRQRDRSGIRGPADDGKRFSSAGRFEIGGASEPHPIISLIKIKPCNIIPSSQS